MAKLNIRKECFQPIENTTTHQIIRDEKHKELVEESNLKIQEDYLKKAKAYENAKNYLAN